MTKRGAGSVSPSRQRPSLRPRPDSPISSGIEVTAIGNYDDRKELLQTLLHRPHFGKAKQDLEHFCDSLRSGVQTEDGEETDSQTRDFLNVLHAVKARLKNVDASFEPIVVALSGRMGAGKSALINSILSEPDLAKESGGALAGTKVVHVLRYKEADQKSCFRRQIKYFSTSQLDVQVRRHARTLFRWAHGEVNDASAEGDVDQDDDIETWDMQQRTTKAQLFFQHGFSKLKERPFRNEGTARAFFGRMKAEDDLTMLETLTNAIRTNVKLLPTMQSNHDLVVEMKRDFAENASNIAWQLVDNIETCIAHPFLRYITLGDTAGNDDSDRDRVERSVEYLRKADSILLVHTIMRVANDESVVEDIAWLRKNNLLEKATLVCTNLDQYLKVEEGTLAEEDKGTLEKARAQRIAAAKVAKQSGLKETERRSLQARKEYTTRCGKDAKAMIRIQETKSAMGARLQEMRLVVQKLPSLPVICVSNKEYMSHLKDPDDEDEDEYEQPNMNIKTTGILTLRRHLNTLVETRILETMSSEVLTPLARCLQDQLLHEHRQHTSCKADLLAFVDAQRPGCKLLVDQLGAELRNGLLVAVIKKMVQNKHSYVNDAISQFQLLRRSRLSRYVHDQCRREGEAAKNKTDDWNQIVVTAFEKDVETGIEQLRKLINDEKTYLLKHVREIAKRVWDELQKLLRSTQESDDDFFQSYKQHCSQFAMRVDGLRKVLVKKHLSRIQQNLLDFESEEVSYVKSAMLPHYKAALKVAAGTKTSVQQRTKIVELAISGPDSNIFDKICSKVEADFDIAMGQWIPKMRRPWRHCGKMS